MNPVWLSHIGTLATAISLVVALTGPAHADDEVAEGYSVAEWREKLGRSELATAAFAAGVMATKNVYAECKNPRTVRDFHTYLLHRALPTITMRQAISRFLAEGGCTVSSADRFTSPTATIYAEEE